MSDDGDERLYDALVSAVIGGSHERDVAIQFGVTVGEVRALMYKNACEAIGVEGVERERFKMLDRLDQLEAICAPKAAAGTRRARSLWTAYGGNGRRSGVRVRKRSEPRGGA